MKIYYSMIMTTDGRNSGPNKNQTYSEHLIKNTEVNNLLFRYFGEEYYDKRNYKRLTKTIKGIYPESIKSTFSNYIIKCRCLKSSDVIYKIGITKKKGGKMG